MRYAFVRFRHPDRGEPRVGLLVDDRVTELSADLLPGGAIPTVQDVIERFDELAPQLEALAAGSREDWIAVDDVEVLAPVEPRQIVQAGANYRTHVIDLAVAHRDPGDPASEEEVRARTAAMMDERAATGRPYFFVGLPTAVSSAYEDLTLPHYSETHDWELELAAVIGRRAFRISEEEALDHVFGYTIVNDITTREFVFRKDMPAIGTDWYRAKNAPGFLPTGPLLVPSAFVGDPQQLQVTLKLNGRTMQDESTSDMIFDVAKLVAAASQTMPLLPGDLVLTGSPAGNGAHWGRLLRDGDEMEGTITGLGTQRVRCQAEVPA